MISIGTVLQIIDNSGARKVKCLKILGGSFKKYGLVGNIMVVSVQSINPLKKIKKGEIYRAVIVSVKKSKQRLNGSNMLFDWNSAVIVSNKNLPLSTRILRPVMLELRSYSYAKIISMSTVVL